MNISKKERKMDIERERQRQREIETERDRVGGEKGKKRRLEMYLQRGYSSFGSQISKQLHFPLFFLR